MSTSFEKNLQKVGENLQANMDKGLLQAALLLQRESQRLVPVDTGALKNSATVRRIEGKEGLGKKIINFGRKLIGKKAKKDFGYEVGYSQSYAVWVHENVTAHHPVGQAKFLEQPARALRGELGRIVALEMKAKSNQGVFSREEVL